MQFNEKPNTGKPTDSFDRLKFVQYDKLQQDIAKEFIVPTELVDALNKGKQLDSKTDYHYAYDIYFERANKYLENIVSNIKDPNKKKSANESLNALKQTFNRLSEYLKVYKMDKPVFGEGKTALQKLCGVENMGSFYEKIETGKKENEVIGLQSGIYFFTTSLDNNILSYNNEDIYDVLMSIYNDAGIGYDKLDDPEAKFLCHISQSLKNSVQKCETVSTQLELLELNKELSESKSQLDKLKKESENLAIKCEIAEIPINEIDEKIDTKIKNIENQRSKFKEESDKIIENKKNEIKGLIEKEYNDNLNKIKEESNVEKNEKELNNLKEKIEKNQIISNNLNNDISILQPQFDKLKAKAELMLKENKAFEGILDEELQRNEDTNNNIVRLYSKDVEKVRESFKKEGLNLDDYLNESLVELRKKVDNGYKNLQTAKNLEGLISQKKFGEDSASFVNDFNINSSNEDINKFVSMIKNYFGAESLEVRKKINNDLKILSEKTSKKNKNKKEKAINSLKSSFNLKNNLLLKKFNDDSEKLISDLKKNGEERTNPEEIQNDLLENDKKLTIVSKIPEGPEKIAEKIKDIEDSKKALEYIKTRKEFLKADKELHELKDKLIKVNVNISDDTITYNSNLNIVNHNKNVAKNKNIEAKKNYDNKVKKIGKDEDIIAFNNVQNKNIEKFNQKINKLNNYRTNIKNSLDQLTQNTIETINNHNSIMDSTKESFNESYDKFLSIIDKNLKNFEIRSVTPDAGSHKNTKSYTDMMESIANARMTLAMGADGSTDEKIQALDNIKNMCNEYIKAKKSQFAPFPSQMRKARLQFAEDLKKYAENASKNLKDTFKETEVAENFKQYTKLNFTKNVVDLVNSSKIDSSKFNKESITQSIINLQKDKNIKSAAESIVKSRKEEIENNKMTDLSLKSKHEFELEKNLKSDSDELEIKLGF